ncbi:flavin reductase family protein [Nonomuraea sp. NPDC050790]|uniref:flavin reductase family protein n=1 Tax=Nonomuraea sp. NPDC050790 TaxID=3364371 RepID=UPI0037BBD9C5
MVSTRLRAVMRQWPTGVAVVTTRSATGPHGVTINSLLSVSLEPPTILVSLSRRSRTHDLVMENRCFTANLLATGQSALAAHFAGERPVGSGAFAGVGWSPSPCSGNAVLSGALAAMDCTITMTVSAADHTLFVGRVEEVHHLRAGEEPLVYAGRAYHRLAGA